MGVDPAWWNALPLEQKQLIARALVGMAATRATGDRQREAALRHLLARLSLELADDSTLLPEVFEIFWQRGATDVTSSA